MLYRKEIDGLRAIAVLPVILFHAGFNTFSGGYVGVDIFFVISGYLITSILLEDLENNKFSIVDFYERRARRILPALFFVLMVTLPASYAIMSKLEFSEYLNSLSAVALFSSNIYFWLEIDYFSSLSEFKPLLHTWSLAVEEQYYIFFPVFLLATWRFGKRNIFLIIVATTILSLLISHWASTNYPSANFYLIPSRAWELLSGSICAFLLRYITVFRSNLLSLIGLSLIAISIFTFDSSTPFPSFYTLLPVLGTSLIIIFGKDETIVSKILSMRLFVFIGLLSYSAYLWHQPIFAYARLINIKEPDHEFFMGLILITFIIAYFSWRYIENPVRNKKKYSANFVFKSSSFGLILFLSLGIIISNLNPEETGKYNPSNFVLGNYHKDNRFLQDDSWSFLRELTGDPGYGVNNNEFDHKNWFDIDGSKNRILLVGNSHSKDLFNVVSNSSNVNNKYQVARFGIQIDELDSKHKFWHSQNYINSTHIVISSRYFQKDIDNLPFILEKLTNDNKKVIVVENIFEFPGETGGFSLIDEIAYDSYKKNLSIEDAALKIKRNYYDFMVSDKTNRSIKINNDLKDIAKNYNVGTLNRLNYICNHDTKMCDAVQDDLTKNFYDYGHHTLDGAVYFSKRLDILQYFL